MWLTNLSGFNLFETRLSRCVLTVVGDLSLSPAVPASNLCFCYGLIRVESEVFLDFV